MTDESYDMTTIEGCIGWGLFRNPPERRRLEAELARLRAIAAAADTLFDFRVRVEPWPGEELHYPGPLRTLRDALGIRGVEIENPATPPASDS